MLSILPRSVKMERAVTEYPKNLPIDSLLSMEGNLPFAWMTRELTESGVLGSSTAAAKEKGDRILESLSDQEFQRWYPPRDLSVESIHNLKSKILKPPTRSVGSPPKSKI